MGALVGSSVAVSSAEKKVRELKEERRRLEKEQKELEEYMSQNSGFLITEQSNKPSPDNNATPESSEKREAAEKEVLKELKSWKEKEDALNRIAYATGEESFRDFEQRKIDIQREYYQKALAENKLSTEERLRIQADAAELEAKVSHERSEKTCRMKREVTS